jgi:Na+-driven multidrug efflux pump
MIEVLSSIGVLVVVVIGVLILLQVTSPGDVLRGAGRALIVLFIVVLALYALKMLWTCILVPWLWAGFASLKAALYWVTITLVALIALLLVARLVFGQVGRHFKLRLGSQGGNRYDYDDH